MRNLCLLFIFTTSYAYGQQTPLEKTIAEIDIQQDTILAVYDWITDNIAYDVNSAREIKKQNRGRKKTVVNKSQKEIDLDMLNKVIKTRKGVCQNYSLLFDGIVSELGYPSYVVSGYTKNENGRLNRSIGHSWNAIYVDGKWRLYDATWGAGSVENARTFVKRYDAEWYDVNPEKMLESHMPYDPMWQLLSNPISYKAFESGSEKTSESLSYDVDELIAEFLALDRKSQMQAELERSESVGDGTSLISKWRKSKKKNLSYEGVNVMVDDLNAASDKGNQAKDLLNEFYTKGRNSNFSKKSYTKEIGKKKLEEARSLVDEAKATYQAVDTTDKASLRKIKKFMKLLQKIDDGIVEQLEYLEE